MNNERSAEWLRGAVVGLERLEQAAKRLRKEK